MSKQANLLDMTAERLWPKRYLTAADLEGHACVVTIENITVEEMWDRQNRGLKKEGVIWFEEFPHKFFCVNRTNREKLIEIIGSKLLKDWIGAQVELHRDTYRRGEKVFDVIRVREVSRVELEAGTYTSQDCRRLADEIGMPDEVAMEIYKKNGKDFTRTYKAMEERREEFSEQ